MINIIKTDATETIKEHLKLIYNGDPWYGDSITSVMNSVDPKLIFDSPGNGLHSIAELTAHMLTYRIFAEDRLQGNTESPPGQEQTFDWTNYSSDKNTVWTVLRERFDTNQHNLLGLMDKHENSLLDKKVEGKPYTFHYLLTGILHHDLYHLGQIVYIHKLLDRENSSQAGMQKYNFKIFPFENLAQLK